VLDFDRDAEGRHFLVMEYVEGRDLDALRDTGPLPPSAIVYITTETLRGLGYAHNLPVPKRGMRGVIHRDVSPHNVLLSWEGSVKLSDFGIAKAREASAATASTLVKGKAAYMSPEQANGEQLDGRSDLFAVGVMLWELLTGQQLFVGTTQEALAQIFFRPIPRPNTIRPSISADLDAVTMRLLERDRNARYATAEHAIADLARCADLPRDGRSELVRILAERFPSAINERLSGRIPTHQPHSPSGAELKGTALERTTAAPVVQSWGTPATTLGVAASQSVAQQVKRSRAPYAIAAIGVAAAATAGVIALQPKDATDSSNSHVQSGNSAAAPAAPPVLPDAAATARVTIESVPSGAEILIDGTSRGTAPLNVQMPAGRAFTVVATRDGFADASTTATAVREGQIVSLTLLAKPASPPDGSTATSRSTKKPVTKPRPSSTVRPATGSNATKPGFDPNDVGGD
jgi:eukaryotic-like serine/threonine-protein kinase